MEQSPLASVLGHLAQTAERQTQLQQGLTGGDRGLRVAAVGVGPPSPAGSPEGL